MEASTIDDDAQMSVAIGIFESLEGHPIEVPFCQCFEFVIEWKMRLIFQVRLFSTNKMLQ